MVRLFSEKDLAYFDYIQEHKKNVLLAYNLIVPHILDLPFRDVYMGDVALGSDLIEGVMDSLLSHDLSKYDRREFWAYRQYFYPENGHTPDKEFFELAWMHHYSNNKHHPENYKGGFMYIRDTLEMIIDWVAMSLNFKNDPYAYYMNRRDKLKEKCSDVAMQWDLIDKVMEKIQRPVMSYITSREGYAAYTGSEL